MVVYRPPPALLIPSAVVAKRPIDAVRVTDVVGALVQHSCSGKTAELNLQLSRGDDARMQALLQHQNKVKRTLKRKLEEAMQEAELSMQAITPLLVETKQRFRVDNLLNHHGAELHVVDVGVSLVSYANDEEKYKSGRLRIAVPSAEAFEYMTEEDASFSENGFAEIMHELAHIAIKARGLDPNIWEPNEAELDPGYYGVFTFFQERLLPMASSASFKSRAECSAFLSFLSNAMPMKDKPRLSGKSLVDAVIYPARYYKKQQSVRIYSPHAVKSSRVTSMMPATLVENSKFGREDDDDSDEDDESDADEDNESDADEDDEEKEKDQSQMQAPKRLCIRSGESK